jgi:hypothetical protein
MTETALRSILASPASLFGLMLLASIGNGFKQIAVVRQTGQPMKCGVYWSYLPETMAALVLNVVGFWVLVMTDQLNYASAIAVGYGTNSLVDFIPGGRSFALKNTPDDPRKMYPQPGDPKL